MREKSKSACDTLDRKNLRISNLCKKIRYKDLEKELSNLIHILYDDIVFSPDNVRDSEDLKKVRRVLKSAIDVLPSIGLPTKAFDEALEACDFTGCRHYRKDDPEDKCFASRNQMRSSPCMASYRGE